MSEETTRETTFQAPSGKPTFDELMEAVRDMRAKQKTYFKATHERRYHKDISRILGEALRAEAVVDRMLERVNSPQETLL